MADLERFGRELRSPGARGHDGFIRQLAGALPRTTWVARRHFTDYETYIIDRHGPRRVDPPPAAPEWLRRHREVRLRARAGIITAAATRCSPTRAAVAAPSARRGTAGPVRSRSA